MKDVDSVSITTKIFSFLFFVMLTIGSFWWFTASSYGTLHSLFHGDEAVHFSKGAMYSLGVGIVLLLLILLGAYQNVKKTDLSKSQTKLVTKAFVLSIVMTFVFPIVAHFVINTMTAEKGYFECKEMSYQWLLYKNIVYVNDQAVCTDLIRNSEINRARRNI